MTIDEAIKYVEEVAKEKSKLSDIYSIADHECASEYRQLAELLKALKEIWDSGDCNDCRNGQCEWKPKLGHLVRYNCPHYIGVANGEVKADADSD